MTVVKIKKAKGTKSVIKRKRKFENYKKTAQFEHKLSERHNVFTDEINKIALNSNDDKRKQPIDLIEIYEYRTSKYLVNDKEEIKCNNIIKWHKKWLTLMML